MPASKPVSTQTSESETSTYLLPILFIKFAEFSRSFLCHIKRKIYVLKMNLRVIALFANVESFSYTGYISN